MSINDLSHNHLKEGKTHMNANLSTSEFQANIHLKLGHVNPTSFS